MGSSESNNAAVFDYFIEDKIEELGGVIDENTRKAIEDLIPLLRELKDPNGPLDIRGPGPTDEELKQPGALGREIDRMATEPDYVKQRMDHRKNQALLIHCQRFKINPSTLADDEIRQLEVERYKKSRKYILCHIRQVLVKHKEGFLQAMTTADRTLRPRVTFDIYMKEYYDALDGILPGMYSNWMFYINNMFWNTL